MNREEERQTQLEDMGALTQRLRDTRLRMALLAAQQLADELEETVWQEMEEMRRKGWRRLLSLPAQSEIHCVCCAPMSGVGIVRHAPPRMLRAVAAVLLICVLGMGTALAVSPALRVAVMRLLYRVTPRYTEISYVPDERASFDVPADWDGLYYPALFHRNTRLRGGRTGGIRDAIYTAEDGGVLSFIEN